VNRLALAYINANKRKELEFLFRARKIKA